MRCRARQISIQNQSWALPKTCQFWPRSEQEPNLHQPQRAQLSFLHYQDTQESGTLRGKHPQTGHSTFHHEIHPAQQGPQWMRQETNHKPWNTVAVVVRHMHKLLQGDALKYQESEERASNLWLVNKTLQNYILWEPKSCLKFDPKQVVLGSTWSCSSALSASLPPYDTSSQARAASAGRRQPMTRRT